MSKGSLLALAAAPVIISAMPAPQVIPFQGAQGEAIIVPGTSGLKFRGWDKYGYAQFTGRVTLTGAFSYGCWAACADYEGAFEKSDLQFRIVPDRYLAAQLPNWKLRRNDMAVLIERDRKLTQTLIGPRELQALLRGKIDSKTGRVSIVVDEFRTGIECDSAHFSARFVSVAKAPQLARVKFDGEYGCG